MSTDNFALLDALIERLDTPISDEDRPQIQDALRLIRRQTDQAGYVRFGEGYQAGYDRGEADATKAAAVPNPFRHAFDDMLEELAADLYSGRTKAH